MNVWVAFYLCVLFANIFIASTIPKGGPVAMLRGAAMYGGFTYVLSGGLTRPRQQFQFKEEALEF